MRTLYLFHDWVCHTLQVCVALVRQVVENVGRPDGLRPPLLVAKDQVNPVVHLARHKL